MNAAATFVLLVLAIGAAFVAWRWGLLARAWDAAKEAYRRASFAVRGGGTVTIGAPRTEATVTVQSALGGQAVGVLGLDGRTSWVRGIDEYRAEYVALPYRHSTADNIRTQRFNSAVRFARSEVERINMARERTAVL